MEGLYARQFGAMLERWRRDNPGQESDEATLRTLRVQGRKI